ncbi:MAG: YdeI/OmpD-associated family protein [candidate division Zixibacteria bacterium]|nr:YdeI/OmpD-associated family protein [candidate division Zixibacteria bacterium]
MGKKDARVDAYIAKSADFAKPILVHLRETVHHACPAVEETMKWSFPHFEYKGVLCSMASFKAHASFGFWKGSLLGEKEGMVVKADDTSMGHLGRITKIADLPNKKTMTQLIKDAMKLNDDGVKVPKTPRVTATTPLEIPDYFIKALRRNKEAQKAFGAFSPSHKKEYIEWIVEAKSDATREKRIEQALEWMSEGKSRNWKYVRK